MRTAFLMRSMRIDGANAVEDCCRWDERQRIAHWSHRALAAVTAPRPPAYDHACVPEGQSCCDQPGACSCWLLLRAARPSRLGIDMRRLSRPRRVTA